jgi:aspartyl-tRNA(Asn)/glutamyl-tRNA(Gln) amidotransferase subunit C
MALSMDDVKETALMARLALSDEEVATMQRELSAILGYVEELSALDVSAVEPTTHAVPLDCPLRPDTLGPQLSADEALADAPRREGSFFEVPKIIDEAP